MVNYLRDIIEMNEQDEMFYSVVEVRKFMESLKSRNMGWATPPPL